MVLTAPIFLAVSTAFARLFLLFSATCTGLVASTARASGLTARNREGSTCQETGNGKPSQDLLKLFEIHESPPVGWITENRLSAQDMKDPLQKIVTSVYEAVNTLINAWRFFCQSPCQASP